MNPDIYNAIEHGKVDKFDSNRVDHETVSCNVMGRFRERLSRHCTDLFRNPAGVQTSHDRGFPHFRN